MDLGRPRPQLSDVGLIGETADAVKFRSIIVKLDLGMLEDVVTRFHNSALGPLMTGPIRQSATKVQIGVVAYMIAGVGAPR
jgi:hypothetical protein